VLQGCCWLLGLRAWLGGDLDAVKSCKMLRGFKPVWIITLSQKGIYGLMAFYASEL
jgi:hypothetical protein